MLAAIPIRAFVMNFLKIIKLFSFRRPIIDELSKTTSKGNAVRMFSYCVDNGLRKRALEIIACHGTESVCLTDQIKLALLCNDLSGATRLAHSLHSIDKKEENLTHRLNNISGLIAPYAPRLALELALAAESPPPCAVVLAKTVNNELLYKSLKSQLWHVLGPDKWLMLANESSDPAVGMERFNDYLHEFGLMPLRLKDSKVKAAVGNLEETDSSMSMHDGPRVSVILTVHNGVTHIEAAICSVLRQTYKNIELIVIDDASDDGTWSKITDAAAGDGRVRPVRLAENIGTYRAKNIGLCMAEGEFVTFQDADDFSHPERISRCVVVLQKNRKLVAVTVCYVRITDAGDFVSSKVWPFTRWTPNSVFFRRRKVLEHIGGFDKVRFGGDSEFVARLKAAFGDTHHHKIRLPLIFAASRPGSLMTSVETGLNKTGFSDVRMQYQEEWAERLLDYVTHGRSLYMDYRTAIAAIY